MIINRSKCNIHICLIQLLYVYSHVYSYNNKVNKKMGYDRTDKNSNVNELTFISVRKLLTSYIIENMI